MESKVLKCLISALSIANILGVIETYEDERDMNIKKHLYFVSLLTLAHCLQVYFSKELVVGAYEMILIMDGTV